MKCRKRTLRALAASFISLLAICVTFAAASASAQSSPQQQPSTKTPAIGASGSVTGTVLDLEGDRISGAQITLTNTCALEELKLTSGSNGEFTFTGVAPGTYFITAHAKGFEPYKSATFSVSAGQLYKMPRIQLLIAVQKQVDVVRPRSVIAQMQITAEEKQCVLGAFPNFYTSYIWNAAPLDTKQKFSLAARDLFDPVTLMGVGAIAGIEQANGSFAGYGPGASGYGKRFAAALGNRLIGGFMGQAVFPSIFHQDPRYFYQGSGSIRSRLLHALSWAVISRSDSGHLMPDYSDFLGDLTSGALSNLYYPPADRGAGLIFTNFAIGIGARAGEAVVEEFLLKRLSTNIPANGKTIICRKTRIARPKVVTSKWRLK